VEALLDNQKSMMIGLVNNEITLISFRRSLKLNKHINHKLIELAKILSA
jgi:6-phosphofructokinase 1